MPDAFNPYSAPLSNLNPQASAGGCWNDMNVVVVSKDADLPPRCVKCNAPAEAPIKTRTYYWHHPALYLLVLPGLLIYAIVALIVRKKAILHLGLCDAHRKKRLYGLLLGWGGGLGGLALMIASANQDSCGLGFTGLAVFFVGIVAGNLMARTLYPERIDETYVRLKGAGPEFLASLPPFRG